jgi:hypothetical protein
MFPRKYKRGGWRQICNFNGIKGRPILFACCKGVRIALRYALQEITNEVDALDYFSMKSSKCVFDFIFYVPNSSLYIALRYAACSRGLQIALRYVFQVNTDKVDASNNFSTK